MTSLRSLDNFNREIFLFGFHSQFSYKAVTTRYFCHTDQVTFSYKLDVWLLVSIYEENRYWSLVNLPSCFLRASSRSLSLSASYFWSRALTNSWSEPVPSYSNNTVATFSRTPSLRSCSCFCLRADSSAWLCKAEEIRLTTKNSRSQLTALFARSSFPESFEIRPEKYSDDVALPKFA